MKPRLLLPTLLVLLGLTLGCYETKTETTSTSNPAPQAKPAPVAPAASGPVTKAGDAPTFANVQKIFKAKCVRCHGEQGAKGLNLTSYDSTMKTDTITAGNAKCEFMDWLNGNRKPQMPKGAAPLDKVDQDLIEAWIVAGAKNG